MRLSQSNSHTAFMCFGRSEQEFVTPQSHRQEHRRPDVLARGFEQRGWGSLARDTRGENSMKTFATRKSLFAMVSAAALSLVLVGPALAADGTTATVTGGVLSITNPLAADFAGANITGVDQTTTAALATFSVSDLTGSGAGWHVTAEASIFDGATHDLAAGSLSLSQPTVESPDTESLDPTVAAGPYVIDDGVVEVASSALNTGMGEYDFGATTLTLALPADVFADAYASNVTVSVVTAP